MSLMFQKTFESPGSYEVKLEVTGADGEQDATTKTILVTEPQTFNLLIGSWQVTQEKYTEDGVTEIYEGEGLGAPCDRDDLVIFKDNNTVNFDEGPTKCDPDAPQVYGTENWSLLNDDTQIQFSSDGDVYAVTIVSLNKSTLVISESGTDTDY